MYVLMLIDSSCNRLLATLLLEMSELMQINSRAIAFFFLPIVLLMLLRTQNGQKKNEKMLFTSLIIDYFNPDKSKIPQCWGIVADFCYHPVFSEWTAFLKVTFGRFFSHFLVIIYIVFFLYIYIMMKQCSHAWNKRHKHGAVTSWISESSRRIMQLIQDCPAIPQNWKKKTEFSCTTAILLIQNE